MDFENLIRSPLELSRLNKKRSTLGSVFFCFFPIAKKVRLFWWIQIQRHAKMDKWQVFSIFYPSIDPNVIIWVKGCIFFLPGAVIYPLSSSPSNKALGSSKCNVETWWKCSEVRKTAEGLEVLTKKWQLIFFSPFDNLANLRNGFVIQNSLYCHVEYYVIV